MSIFPPREGLAYISLWEFPTCFSFTEAEMQFSVLSVPSMRNFLGIFFKNNTNDCLIYTRCYTNVLSIIINSCNSYCMMHCFYMTDTAACLFRCLCCLTIKDSYILHLFYIMNIFKYYVFCLFDIAKINWIHVYCFTLIDDTLNRITIWLKLYAIILWDANYFLYKHTVLQ